MLKRGNLGLCLLLRVLPELPEREEVSAPSGDSPAATGTISSSGCPENTLGLGLENHKSRNGPKFFPYERRPHPPDTVSSGVSNTLLPPTLHTGKTNPRPKAFINGGGGQPRNLSPPPDTLDALFSTEMNFGVLGKGSVRIAQEKDDK